MRSVTYPLFCASLAVVAALSCERQSGPPQLTTDVPRSAARAPAAAAAPPAPPLVSSAAPEPARAPAPTTLEAEVHLPPQLAAGQKAPLLLMLHSIGTSAEDIERRTDWPKFAESHGIAWMAPNGPMDALGRRFWDAGESCCNFTAPHIDHVGALRALIQSTLDRYPIDPERVYVGGISNGGFMAHRLACEAPELLRGVVSVSGAGPLEAVTCKQPNGLRVLEIHGDADPIVSYAGGHFLSNPLLPRHASARKTMEDWAAILGCAEAPVAGDPLDLEKRFAGKETRVSRYPSCARGALELWTVSGGDHYLAFYEPAPQAIWRFLND